MKLCSLEILTVKSSFENNINLPSSITEFKSFLLKLLHNSNNFLFSPFQVTIPNVLMCVMYA